MPSTLPPNVRISSMSRRAFYPVILGARAVDQSAGPIDSTVHEPRSVSGLILAIESSPSQAEGLAI